MENLLTNKTASLTELRDPKKVIENAGEQPVAILNRNKLEGYFVPASAVGKIDFRAAEAGSAASRFKSRRGQLESTLDYLKDK